MPAVEFLPLDPRTINVRTFDCGKEAINVYLRRYAAKNMALNSNRQRRQRSVTTRQSRTHLIKL